MEAGAKEQLPSKTANTFATSSEILALRGQQGPKFLRRRLSLILRENDHESLTHPSLVRYARTVLTQELQRHARDLLSSGLVLERRGAVEALASKV